MNSAGSLLLEKWLQAALYVTETAKLGESLDTVRTLRTLTGQYETYCPGCRKDALFRIAEDNNAIAQFEREKKERRLAAAAASIASTRQSSAAASSAESTLSWFGEFKVHLRCMRRPEHFISIYLISRSTDSDADQSSDGDQSFESRVRNRQAELQKVGQAPSLADFHLHQIDRLEAAFSDSDLREWKRAVITQAHGFNIAGCVHLRRLFERVLLEARDVVDGGKHKGEPWDEFDRAHMSDKVKLVAAELPPFIVEHPELYGVLSKGVHQLTEEECGRELPVLQRCMTLIVQQRLERQMRDKMEIETKKLLADSASRVGKA